MSRGRGRRVSADVQCRGGVVEFPNADAGVVASGHGSIHSLQHLCRISQVCIVDRRSRTVVFAQCAVDPKTGLVQNGMYSPDGVILLRHLLGVWHRSGERGWTDAGVLTDCV